MNTICRLPGKTGVSNLKSCSLKYQIMPFLFGSLNVMSALCMKHHDVDLSPHCQAKYYSVNMYMRSRPVFNMGYFYNNNFEYEHKHVIMLLKNGILRSIGNVDVNGIADKSLWNETDFLYTKKNCCPGKTECTHLKIPDEVVEIARNTFNYMCIDHVEFPESVKKIGKYAFYDTPLRGEVEIPASVESLGKGCFGCCELIENIKFNEGLLHIGDGCFSNCVKLKQLMLPDSVQTIGDMIYFKCKNLSEFKFPKNLTNGEGLLNTRYIYDTSIFHFCRVFIVPDDCLCNFTCFQYFNVIGYSLRMSFEKSNISYIGDSILGKIFIKKNKSIEINERKLFIDKMIEF